MELIYVRKNLKNLIVSNHHNEAARYIQDNLGVINTVDNKGNTLLHFAVTVKKPQIIRKLILLNCDMFIQNNLGETAFFIACKKGYIFIVKLFLSFLSLIDKSRIISNVEYFNGFSPLLISYKERHYPICKLLILNGADYIATNWRGFRISNFHLHTLFRDSLVQFVRIEVSRTDNVIKKESISTEPPTFLLNDHAEMLVELKKNCPICLEDYKKEEVVFIKECHHPVCKQCFPKLDKCYFCRK